MTPDELLRLVDSLTAQLHQAQRLNIVAHSGHIGRDLAALRVEVNAVRFSAGLGPSPVQPVYPDEETD